MSRGNEREEYIARRGTRVGRNKKRKWVEKRWVCFVYICAALATLLYAED